MKKRCVCGAKYRKREDWTGGLQPQPRQRNKKFFYDFYHLTDQPSVPLAAAGEYFYPNTIFIAKILTNFAKDIYLFYCDKLDQLSDGRTGTTLSPTPR